jgi:hypothetical protein
MMMGLWANVLVICVFVSVCRFLAVSVCEIELLIYHMYMNCEFVLFDVLCTWRRIKK